MVDPDIAGIAVSFAYPEVEVLFGPHGVHVDPGFQIQIHCQIQRHSSHFQVIEVYSKNIYNFFLKQLGLGFKN
jgi:hypothetical protein